MNPRRSSGPWFRGGSWVLLAVALAAAAGLRSGWPGARWVKAGEARPMKRVAYRQPGRTNDLLDGGVAYLNTSGPIHLQDLRGKIVLLDFWTYCCINCHHILPDLARLEQKYGNALVVIGVHTAKFPAERETENIRKKVREYRIGHPVINDANQVIWDRFEINTWPTLVVIDPAGNPMRPFLRGEGNEAALDRLIGELVALHRARGDLDETPVQFFPEKEKADETPLLFPGKVLADAAGDRLFISDTGHNRIVITSRSGQAIATVGSGVEGLADGSYDRAKFNRPQGMCLIDDTLYVADTENHAIRAIDLKAEQVATVAGTGQQGPRRRGRSPAKSTALSSPWGLVPIPGTNTLAIAMAGLHQIWKLDLKAGVVSVWAGSGTENIKDGSLEAASFAQPSGLATDGQHLFVADSEASGIRSIALGRGKGPAVQTIVGVDLFEFGDQDGYGRAVRLQHCLGLTFADGVLFIADTYNNKIKVCQPETREVKTFVGSTEAGDSDDPPRFDEPGGLSVADGTLYVTDTNNHAIRVVDLKTYRVSTLTLSGVKPPTPARSAPRFPRAEVVEVTKTQVAPGKDFTIQVALDVPPTLKLNPEAPMPYLLEAPDQPNALGPAVSPSGSRVDPPSRTFTVAVPLARPSQPGQNLNLKLSVSSFLCREGSEGYCTTKNTVWNIPIIFASGAPRQLTVTNPAPRAAQRED